MKTYGRSVWGLLLLLLLPAFSGAACLPADLKAALVANAEGLAGLTAAVTDRNDNVILQIVNATRSAALYRQNKGAVSRDDFIQDWLDVIQNVPSITDPTLRNKWLDIRQLLYIRNVIDYSRAPVQNLLNQMVLDGLMGASGAITSTDVTTRSTRPGSWAELKCGKLLTLDEVSTALNLP